jgi:hypothetical protein
MLIATHPAQRNSHGRLAEPPSRVHVCRLHMPVIIWISIWVR